MISEDIIDKSKFLENTDLKRRHYPLEECLQKQWTIILTYTLFVWLPGVLHLLCS